METINDYWDEYNEWLETQGLHDEEEPPEDTFVGYDEDGEEIHLPAVPLMRIMVGVGFGYESPKSFGVTLGR